MKVTLIGTGNVALVLGYKIRQAGHQILQVYGRNSDRANALAQMLQATGCSNLEQINGKADVVVIAVSDTAIPAIAAGLGVQQGIVVHTAGSVPLQVLAGSSVRYGVIYPLQSLHAGTKPDVLVPLLVEGADEDTQQQLLQWAKGITGLAAVTSTAERLKLHLAAVFVSNFTNHLYALTEAYCREEGLAFDRLLPLIKEVACRLPGSSPALLQTGPAIRQDQPTIERHLALLEHNPHLKQLYDLFTQSIQDFHRI